jgi:two-component system, NarL family, response regulator YdfI
LELLLIQVAILAAAAAVRAGLRSLLGYDPNLHVLYEAASITLLEPMDEKPEVLVINLDENIIPIIIEYLNKNPQVTPLFLVSGDDDIQRITQGYRQPVWGILPFESGAAELAAAVNALAQGLVVGNPAIINSIVKHSTGLEDGTPEEELAEALTPREKELLQLISRGLTNKQIALLLSISEHTVKFHLSSIFSKLGVYNRTEAVRSGIRHGIITL